MHYRYTCRGTCSRFIDFDLNDNIVTNVSYTFGCPGNLKAISRLVDGMTVEEIVKKLKGVKCGEKPTSCSDQLATAVLEAYEQSKK